jgi:hypothetical protein
VVPEDVEIETIGRFLEHDPLLKSHAALIERMFIRPLKYPG